MPQEGSWRIINILSHLLKKTKDSQCLQRWDHHDEYFPCEFWYVVNVLELMVLPSVLAWFYSGIFDYTDDFLHTCNMFLSIYKLQVAEFFVGITRKTWKLRYLKLDFACLHFSCSGFNISLSAVVSAQVLLLLLLFSCLSRQPPFRPTALEQRLLEV